MKKWKFFFVLVALLLTVAACGSAEAVEPSPTPENPYLEEELAAEAFSTASAKNAQTPFTDLPYVEISDRKKTYLAFRFAWNDETVFLPIAESTMTDSGLLSCWLDADTGLAIGELFTGWKFVQDECVPDETASQNAPSTIKIPGYFDEGLKLDQSNDTESRVWNIIDLNGEYAENFAEIVTFIVENDLHGSGDLAISIYRMDGPNSEQYTDVAVGAIHSINANC